eukprot:8602039-Pyramimonas_sp.AAC.1
MAAVSPTTRALRAPGPSDLDGFHASVLHHALRPQFDLGRSARSGVLLTALELPWLALGDFGPRAPR